MTKQCKVCNNLLDLSMFHKHHGNSDGLMGKCKSCHSTMAKQQYLKARDSRLAKMAEYRINKRDSVLEGKKRYYRENKDKCREMNKSWSAKNRDVINNLHKKWYKNNKHKALANTRIFQAKRRQAMPKWLTKDDKWLIEQAYELSALRTKIFGFKWHVDHIIPLSNKLVCGLHVIENLQVIPASENLSKTNKFSIGIV
jgi:hypothetical protein